LSNNMTNSDNDILLRLFRGLDSVQLRGADHFAAVTIPSFVHYRLAKDSRSRPTLLLAVFDTGRTSSAPPIMLRNIEVQHDVHCHIHYAGGATESAAFTVIRCNSDSETLHALFLRVCATVLDQIGPDATRAAVLYAVNRLVELFRSLERPATKTIVGLWAELFVIERSCDPTLMLSSWHTSASDLLDFSCGEQRLEVKASSRHLRQHHFRLEQLLPPLGSRCIIASLFVEPAGAGVSISELVATISGEVTDIQIQTRLHALVFQSLGEKWETGAQERFDYEAARDSLRFYDALAVPRIAVPLPNSVSDVHFISDLSGLNPISDQHLKSSKNLFAACVSR